MDSYVLHHWSMNSYDTFYTTSVKYSRDRTVTSVSCQSTTSAFILHYFLQCFSLPENTTFSFMTTHSLVFIISEANCFGELEAQLIAYIRQWIQHNRAKDRNYQRGKYWMYCSYREFTTVCSHWTLARVRRALMALCKKGVLIKGRFNKAKYDKTLWYTFADERMIDGPLADNALPHGENVHKDMGTADISMSQQSHKDMLQSTARSCDAQHNHPSSVAHPVSSPEHFSFAPDSKPIPYRREERDGARAQASAPPSKERSASPSCQAGGGSAQQYDVPYTLATLHGLPDFEAHWGDFVRLYDNKAALNDQPPMDTNTEQEYKHLLCESSHPTAVLQEALQLGSIELRMVRERTEQRLALIDNARTAMQAGYPPQYTTDHLANQLVMIVLASVPEPSTRLLNKHIATSPPSVRVAVDYLRQQHLPQQAQVLLARHNELVDQKHIISARIEEGF